MNSFKIFFLFIFFFLPVSQLFSANLKVTFISVGSGDSALIETPAGQNILIDGGDKDQGTDTIIPLLVSKDIRRIDHMIVSNNDSDHYSGIQDILNNGSFAIGTFYHSEPFGVVPCSATVLQAQTAGRLNQIVQLSTNNTPTLNFGGELTVDVLKSDMVIPGTSNSRNKNSNVIKIAYNLISFLFTGDCDDQAINNIIANKASMLRSTVIKVPHHGSANLPTPAATASLIGIVKPEIAVVSVGGSSFGLPDQDTLKLYSNNGAQVYRTDREGNITIETNGISYAVSTSLTDSAQKSAGKISNVHVYPNPVKNQKAAIVYALDGRADFVKAKIFTCSGELVQSFDGSSNSGGNFIDWNLKNQEGDSVASGLYIVLIEAKTGPASVYEKSRFAVVKK